MEIASRAPTRIDFLELLRLRQEREHLLSQVRPLFCYKLSISLLLGPLVAQYWRAAIKVVVNLSVFCIG